MLKRVERPGGKGASGFGSRLKIPKKGRIRLVLIIVVLIAVARIFSGRASSTGAINHHTTLSPEPIQRDKPQQSVPTTPETKPEPVQKEHASILGRLGFGKETIPENNFVASDLAELLRRHPPRLNAATDTISANNRSYVLHYSFDSTVERCGHMLLKQYHPKYGALVAMESATGRVLALVSYTRDSEPPLGDNLFDRSLFPAASVFKTITASAAIEKANMNPESKMPLAGRRYTLY
jgi:hypothetical protein